MYGHPKDTSKISIWPRYSKRALGAEIEAFELYLVDGRFRITSCMEALLHGNSDSLVLVHDFQEREGRGYEVMTEVADVMDTCCGGLRNLVVLRRKPSATVAAIKRIIELHRYDEA